MTVSKATEAVIFQEFLRDAIWVIRRQGIKMDSAAITAAIIQATERAAYAISELKKGKA